jgi:hypothetical protein
MGWIGLPPKDDRRLIAERREGTRKTDWMFARSLAHSRIGAGLQDANLTGCCDQSFLGDSIIPPTRGRDCHIALEH